MYAIKIYGKTIVRGNNVGDYDKRKVGRRVFGENKIRTAVLLFTYKRSYHTERVLDALKHNTVLPSKLYIFQDGQGCGVDASEWYKVNSIIKSVDWCEKEIIVSDYNKGLAASIVDGINYAFKEYDAVIVLEDDCVAAINFISFMEQCFEKYKDNEKVYSVSGYSYPVVLEKGKNDVYGCGRISSWGWGTWKDKWNIYHKDYEIIRRMKQEERASRNLAIWGSDLEDMLCGNVRGLLDSWAVFWALGVISKEGICINPYKSLIVNIGLDGSGTNCDITNRYDVELEGGKRKEFSLPDRIEMLPETQEAFIPLFGRYTALNRGDKFKEKVLVYCLGNFYIENEKKLNEIYNVEAFIDRKKQGWFAGKRIIRIEEISKYTYDKIIIMIYDIQECINIARKLIEYGIAVNKILPGSVLYGKYSEYVGQASITQNGALSVMIEGEEKTIASKEAFHKIMNEQVWKR